jgi:hypothetical protein
MEGGGEWNGIRGMLGKRRSKRKKVGWRWEGCIGGKGGIV